MKTDLKGRWVVAGFNQGEQWDISRKTFGSRDEAIEMGWKCARYKNSEVAFILSDIDKAMAHDLQIKMNGIFPYDTDFEEIEKNKTFTIGQIGDSFIANWHNGNKDFEGHENFAEDTTFKSDNGDALYYEIINVEEVEI